MERPSMTDAQTRPGFFKTWLIAVRPFAYTASVLSVALGLALAYYRGAGIRWLPLAVTLVGVVLFHTAANLLNDCFDYKRGLDVEPTPVSGAVVRYTAVWGVKRWWYTPQPPLVMLPSIDVPMV